MKRTWLRERTKKQSNIIFTFVFGVNIFYTPTTLAAKISTSSDQCVDVLLLFARGSGQNSNSELVNDPLDENFFDREKESYTFFKHHSEHFNNDYPNISYKAVTIHDFPGKYDPVGYRAVGVGLSEIANTANADASWIPGDYQASVQHGIAETVGYLKDQIASCPNQYFIVGGYSQGAQVMGESLFKLTAEERSKILGVGFFGDPKYVGSTGGLGIKPAFSFSWRRGEATNKDVGMLEPRFPYIPEGLEHRTLSWCNRYDIVCGGWSAYRKDSSHSSYSSNSIGYAARELVTIAAPQLLALDRSANGASVPTVQLSKADRDRERDVMFVLNDNSNNSVLNTFRYSLDPMLDQFVRNFTGTRFAAKSFGEHDYGFSAPRVDNIQPFLPYSGYNPSDPVFTSSNLARSFAAKYPFGRPIIGGGDLEDPHQLAIERAVVNTGWSTDPDTERNIILITDRPPKDPYEYNICNGIIRQWMHFPDVDGYKNCYTNYHREVWQKVLIPETCETILKVITQDTCTNPLMSPHYVQMNKRTLEDEVKLAQTYKIKISVVIPHKFDPVTHLGNKLSDPKVRDKLKFIADATGGIFIYYDNKTQYNHTSLYDTLWRVFTKKPHTMNIVADGEVSANVLDAQTNTPTILDVSRSGIVATSYKWDFDDNGIWDETSTAPVIEHEFKTTGQGLFKVQALGPNGAILAESRQLYAVAAGETSIVNKPSLPQATTASQQPSGAVLINWLPQESNRIVISDSATNLPLATAPLSDASIILPTYYENVTIRVISDTATSDPLTMSVEPYLVPSPVIPAAVVTPVPQAKPCCEIQNPNPAPEEPPVLQGPNATPPVAVITTSGPQQNNILRTAEAPISATNPITQEVSSTPLVAGVSTQEPTPATNAKPPATVQKPDKKLSYWWLLLLVAAIIIAFRKVTKRK